MTGLGLFPSPDNLQKVNIVMVGDQGAGKTNMLVSYCNNDYPTEYKPTVHDYYTGEITTWISQLRSSNEITESTAGHIVYSSRCAKMFKETL